MCHICSLQVCLPTNQWEHQSLPTDQHKPVKKGSSTLFYTSMNRDGRSSTFQSRSTSTFFDVFCLVVGRLRSQRRRLSHFLPNFSNTINNHTVPAEKNRPGQRAFRREIKSFRNRPPAGRLGKINK